MRIIYSFTIVLTSVFLFLLPLSTLVYNYRTDPRTDDFTVTTAAGVTTANVTLLKFIYDDDTGTVSFSSTIDEVPALTSYNATSKTILVSALTDNTSRTLSVTYDVNVIEESDAINNLLDRVAWIWMLIVIAFPMAGLAAIWTGRG